MKTNPLTLIALAAAIVAPAAASAEPSALNLGRWKSGKITLDNPDAPQGSSETVDGWVTTEVTIVNPSPAPVSALVIAYDAAGDAVFCAQVELAPNGSSAVPITAQGDGGAVKVVALDGAGIGPALVAFQQDLYFAKGESSGTTGAAGMIDGDLDLAGTLMGPSQGMASLDVHAGLYGTANFSGSDVGELTHNQAKVSLQGSASGEAELSGDVTLDKVDAVGKVQANYAGKHLQAPPGLDDVVFGALDFIGVGEGVKDLYYSGKDFVEGLQEQVDNAQDLADDGKIGETTEDFQKESMDKLENPDQGETAVATDTFEAGAILGAISLTSGNFLGAFASTQGIVKLVSIGLGGDLSGSSAYQGALSGQIHFSGGGGISGVGGSPGDETVVGDDPNDKTTPSASVEVIGTATGPLTLKSTLAGTLSGPVELPFGISGQTQTDVLSMATAMSPLTPLPERFLEGQLTGILSYCGAE